MMKFVIAILGLLSTAFFVRAQNLTAEQIIQKSEENIRGGDSYSQMKMTIIRPAWERETTMQSWAKGSELALIQVTGPSRDKGIAYLKRDNEIWNWQPRIERTIKLPPSMMSQSWMGSDFTNDDLVRESSLVKDYTHQLLGEEKVREYDTYKVALHPKENAAVVWGKIIMWISKEYFMQIKSEFYDEDGFLINTMNAGNVKQFGERHLPSRLEVIPEDKPGQKTIVEYLEFRFNEDISERMFTIQNMKNIR
ncbi:outer membrane lipoprotein-sorting protein [Membranihabitans maritimus]|uniref:outer membrane lipoprotein-sorting protein n=1 Tax=Membranihabitans maritimus TaxID=2904244 RepID=UPI001F20D36A|nr:outer membrane lipoprotein-sorting protein [Membranihabitans maritimus]